MDTPVPGTGTQRDRADRASASVVLVDDETDILHILSDVLHGEGYAVATFSRADVALRYCQSHRPSVVVTDLLMPNIDGYSFIRQLRRSLPDVPVLLMSASATPAHRHYHDAQAFLEKPFDVQDFLDRIQQLLETANVHSYAPARVTAAGHHTRQ